MKVDISKAWVAWAQIGFGIMVYALFEPRCHSPLGFVWGTSGQGKKTCFNVLGSYTVRWARRQGVRTRINREIFESFEVIRTAHGSKDGGEAFLRASGYKFSADADFWWKCRPPKKKTKGKR